LKKHKIHPEEIESVAITTGLAHPKSFSQDPVTEGDAVFSVPHCAAMLIMGVTPGPDWQKPGSLNHPRVAELRHRITLRIGPAMAEEISAQARRAPGVIKEAPAKVDVRARGSDFTESVRYHLGNPRSDEFKMSEADIVEKFRTNAASLLPASTAWLRNISGMIETCLHLERIACVEELTRLCRPGE